MTIDGVRYTPGPKNKRRPRRLNSTTKKGKIDVGTTEKIGQQIQLMAHTKQTKKMQAINLILTIIDFGLHDVMAGLALVRTARPAITGVSSWVGITSCKTILGGIPSVSFSSAVQQETRAKCPPSLPQHQQMRAGFPPSLSHHP